MDDFKKLIVNQPYNYETDPTRTTQAIVPQYLFYIPSSGLQFEEKEFQSYLQQICKHYDQNHLIQGFNDASQKTVDSLKTLYNKGWGCTACEGDPNSNFKNPDNLKVAYLQIPGYDNVPTYE